MKRILSVLKASAIGLLLLMSSVAVGQTVSDVQDKLMLDLTTLLEAHEVDKPFYENVLRRKNENLRDRVAEQIKAGTIEDEVVGKIVSQQIELLTTLIRESELAIDTLAKQSRTAEEADKVQINLNIQRRIAIMDLYYQQLDETLSQAEARGVDVKENREAFRSAMLDRVDFLSNAILYLDTQQREVQTRLPYVSEDEKAVLTNEAVRLNERKSMMIQSFESGISLLGAMGIDVTEDKQLLLSMTGDINADVLDIDVALGLLDGWATSFKEWAYENTPSVIVKLTLFLGIIYFTLKVSRVVGKGVRKSVKHSKMDFSVLMQDFFVSMASKAVVFVGLLVALSQIGIEMGPLLTGFGVAGVIIGFALQDTLSNFASGLMILIYRPYDVGDMVKVAGIQGTVRNMSLVSTTVQTIDNQRLVIPNNKIWGDVINNITAERIRRVDMVFGIGYGEDIDEAKAIFNDIINSDKRVLKDPEPAVKVHTLNESSVDFVVRPWVNTEDYWDVYWDVTETVKKRLDEAGISIPFPQRDVHLYTHTVEKDS
ncbi:mechanosensitive ion channel domain-containing protein [Vibrio mexicanus]|uniref:mechanosensitive ion channel family protein n=1 Tax=Vibrio mexicanus TaxID=1004326 RepID=UPI00063CB806